MEKKKWKKIAQFVKGRTNIQIKNRFESYIKKKVATSNLIFRYKSYVILQKIFF